MTLLEMPKVADLRATGPLAAASFARLRRRMQLDCCKWDSQLGDLCTLGDFALVIRGQCWANLSRWAERLAGETLAAEEEIAARPALWPLLGMPWRLARVMRGHPLTPGGVRAMRFDFHPTSNGWRVSEVNSDVPGGYTESSSLPALMAEEMGCNLRPLGNPAETWADGMVRACSNGRVALTCATGLMDDMQIVACLARMLEARGCRATVVSLPQIVWEGGRARLGGKLLDGIFRFYQAEWMAEMPRRSGWANYFAGASTPVSNAAICVFSESKGFPLLWDRLGCSLETWRELLPETRALRDVGGGRDESWVLKEKYSNNGESVGIRSETGEGAWRKIRRHAFWFGNSWVAQERFETQTIDTPAGPMRPCLGVYVIDGRVAGVYGRLSRRQIVDCRALDVAVLAAGETDDA